jgi:hypothetical protein
LWTVTNAYRLNSGNAYCHLIKNLLTFSLHSKDLNIKIKNSIILRAESKFRVFENRVLRRTLGPKREEVAGDWRRLHNEELHYFYATPNTRMYPKVSGLAAWSENCNWYSSLPLGAVVSPFCESVY